jgi:hypothetical protein
MSTQIIFTENKLVEELFSELTISQNSLFHYTSKETVSSIQSGQELWITRADYFHDKEEIKYGIGVIKQAAKHVLNKAQKEFTDTFISALEEILQESYILSLTENPSSKYLFENYGNNVIEFDNNFSLSVGHIAWHSIKMGASFSSYYFNDNYETIEGHVIYDYSKQLKIAKIAVKAIVDIINSSGHVVDIYHVRKIVIMCITLFKNKKYTAEEEYRLAFIRKTTGSQMEFNETRLDK